MAEPRPSVTAAVVAATLLLLRDDPELGRFVDRSSLDAIERSIREPLPGIGWALDRVPWWALRRLARGVERLISPGFVTHYALRKHLIRTNLLSAVEDGHTQVVLVGAGFDMLSASLPANVHVFEADLPATQQSKRRAVEGLPPCACRIDYVPVDLARESLVDVLFATPGFDRTRDTVFVAEGLLMYLDTQRVEAIFDDVGKLEGRVRFVVSVVTPDARGRVRIHTQHEVVDLCMRLLGERFKWGESVEGLDGMLKRFDLRLDAAASPATIDGANVAPGHAARRTGEVIVVASSTKPRVARPAVAVASV